MDKLIEFLQRILDWFVELLLWWPRKLWQLVLDGMASLIEAIPVPSFMSSLGSFASGLDPGIAFFLNDLQIGTGLGMIISAYIIRFVIRRIPLIG